MHTTHKQFKRRYGRLTTKSRLPYYFVALFIGLVLIGFGWLEYNRVVTNNIWWGELQDTKRISIMAERECGAEVWEVVKMNR